MSTADSIVYALIAVTAPAQTAFILLYGLGSPWWRTLIGRALFTKALGLAALVDLALAYWIFGDDYAARDVVRVCVFGLILVGAWLQLLALLKEKWHARQESIEPKF